MIVVGLVGTPAAGKSSAAEFLADLGAEWINADQIARQCLSHPDVVAALTARFGGDKILHNGSIDRSKLADLVFGSDAAKQESLRFLEAQIHPRTRLEINRRIESAAVACRAVALLDVPLLFETGWDRACDQIWCIDADRENRLQRCQKRGWDASELDRRESNQLPIETKNRLSNHVMRNDATLEALHEKLRVQWNHLARMFTGAAAQYPAESPAVNPPQVTARHCSSDRTAMD